MKIAGVRKSAERGTTRRKVTQAEELSSQRSLKSQRNRKGVETKEREDVAVPEVSDRGHFTGGGVETGYVLSGSCDKPSTLIC